MSKTGPSKPIQEPISEKVSRNSMSEKSSFEREIGDLDKFAEDQEKQSKAMHATAARLLANEPRAALDKSTSSKKVQNPKTIIKTTDKKRATRKSSKNIDI